MFFISLKTKNMNFKIPRNLKNFWLIALKWWKCSIIGRAKSKISAWEKLDGTAAPFLKSKTPIIWKWRKFDLLGLILNVWEFSLKSGWQIGPVWFEHTFPLIAGKNISGFLSDILIRFRAPFETPTSKPASEKFYRKSRKLIILIYGRFKKIYRKGSLSGISVSQVKLLKAQNLISLMRWKN